MNFSIAPRISLLPNIVPLISQGRKWLDADMVDQVERRRIYPQRPAEALVRKFRI
jgi:hypothetical protein